MNSMEPNRLPANRWRDWLLSASRLQTRFWIQSALLGLLVFVAAVSLLVVLPRVAGVLVMLIAAPFILAIFIRVWFRLEGYRVPKMGARVCLKVVGRMLVLGISGWLILLVLLALVMAIGLGLIQIINPDFFSSAPNGTAQTELVANSMLGQMHWLEIYFAALLIMILPTAAFYAQSMFPWMSVWFAITLLASFDMSLKEAYALSRQAEARNALAVNAITLTCLLLLLTVLLSGGVLALMAFPFIGALHYVSFKDVFSHWVTQLERHVPNTALVPSASHHA